MFRLRRPVVVFFLSDTSPAFFRTWYRHEKILRTLDWSFWFPFNLTLRLRKHPNNTYSLCFANPDEVCEEDEGGDDAESSEAHGRPRVPRVLQLCGAAAGGNVVLGGPGDHHHDPACQEHQTTKQGPDWLCGNYWFKVTYKSGSPQGWSLGWPRLHRWCIQQGERGWWPWRTQGWSCPSFRRRCSRPGSWASSWWWQSRDSSRCHRAWSSQSSSPEVRDVKMIKWFV